MKPWLVDANDMWKNNVEDIQIIIDSLMPLQSVMVKKFLQQPIGDKTILVGPKGTGKSLLLAAKSFQLRSTTKKHKQAYHFFPDDLVERLQGGTDLRIAIEKNPKLWKRFEEWRDVWSLAIEAAACETTGLINDYTKDELALFQSYFPPMYKRNSQRHRGAKIRTLGEYLIQVVTNWSRSDFRDEMLSLQRNVIRPSIRAFDEPICFFIDSPDEALDANQTPISPEGFTPWVCLQLGLLYAVRSLSELKGNFFVFTGLRSEIYNAAKFSGLRDSDNQANPLFQQAASRCLILKYTAEELEQIFELNCENDRESWKGDGANAIARFLGTDNAAHPCVRKKCGEPETEKVFHALLRHTMFKPRDLMVMGGAIHDIQSENRTQEEIRKVINRQATQIFDHYKNQLSPTWDRRYEAVLKYVSSNVIHRTTLEFARNKFLKSEPTSLDHCPFHYLYAHGLLGIRNLSNNTQTFVTDPETRGQLTGVLPSSDWYYLHPILHEEMQNIHGENFAKNNGIITGYGCSSGDSILFRVFKDAEGNVFVHYKETNPFSAAKTLTLPIRLCIVFAKTAKITNETRFSEHDLLLANEQLISESWWSKQLSVEEEIKRLNRNTSNSKQVNGAFKKFGFSQPVITSSKNKYSWKVCRPHEISFDN